MFEKLMNYNSQINKEKSIKKKIIVTLLTCKKFYDNKSLTQQVKNSNRILVRRILFN